MYACIEERPAKPLRIEAGGRFVDRWKVWGSNSPQTRPRITLEDHTGMMVMTYVLTDSAGRGTGTLTSHPFDVVAPVPPANRDTLRVTSDIGLRVIPDSVVVNHGGDRSYATVNLRIYNRRLGAIDLDRCSWRVEEKNGSTWQTIDAAHCAASNDILTLAAGDSADFSFRIEDSPDLQAGFHRGALVTGLSRVVIAASAGAERLTLESNTFALFANGWVLPSEVR
jgi:hypothetical protein